jgi:hypothetical protein
LYTVEAAGSDVWSSADEYGAVYEGAVSGDVVARTTVESQEDVRVWSKSGIMMANDITAPGSSAGDLIVAVTPGNGFAVQWDDDGDGFVDANTNVGTTTYPCDLRVTKSGSEFTGEYSTDGGNSWTTIETVVVPEAAETQDVGLFTTAHDSDTTCSASFANFAVTSPQSNLSSIDTTSAQDAVFSESDGSYTLEAAGVDVWSSADEYGAVYEGGVSGDVVARTTVESQEDVRVWSKSGIMVANDITAAGSSAGDLLVAVTPGNGFAVQWDDDGDGFVDANTNVGTTTYPCDLRVTKSGSEFTGEYSTDGGTSWTAIESVTVPEATDSQDVGLFTTAHDSDTTCAASFSNFDVV